jgi:zinc transport system substrate-binding protein
MMKNSMMKNSMMKNSMMKNSMMKNTNYDPKNSKFYHTNAKEYNKKLDLLDSKIQNELSNCSNDFITFHDAFSYFADEYGLNQHTIIPTSNSHGEVTAKTLEKVILTAKKLNITIIFSEEGTSSKSSEIIANEIGGKVLTLSPLEVVSDGTYISRMTENLENLKEALCQ